MNLQFVTRVQDFFLRWRESKNLPSLVWGVGILLALAAVVAISGQLFFQSDPDATSPNSMDSNLLSLSIFIKLMLAVGVMALCLYLIRRWRRGILGTSLHAINLRETTRLSQRQAIHLIQVGERYLLIGATDQNLSLLAEIDDDSLPSLEPQNPVTTPDFATLLRRFLPKSIGDKTLKEVSTSEFAMSGLGEDREEVDKPQ